MTSNAVTLRYLMPQRYDLRQEENGTWTVFDVFTRFPVVVKERVMIGMDVQDADETSELLNIADKKRREATK